MKFEPSYRLKSQKKLFVFCIHIECGLEKLPFELLMVSMAPTKHNFTGKKWKSKKGRSCTREFGVMKLVVPVTRQESNNLG